MPYGDSWTTAPPGNNLIEEWYMDLPEEAQAEFDVTLKTLVHNGRLEGSVGIQKSRAGRTLRDSF